MPQANAEPAIQRFYPIKLERCCPIGGCHRHTQPSKEPNMSKLQNLPIGLSSFANIRTRNYLYVDKTRHIHQMVDQGEYYFMSRPRRFGKSLTVSTLQCLFRSKKELFDGLWIAEQGQWEWKEYPVVVIDFNLIPRFNADVLRQGISLNLKQTARDCGVTLETDFIETQLQELVIGLKKKFKRHVVILVDEYDKPIIDHLGEGEEGSHIAKQNRNVIKSFFGVLKGAQVAECLRFVFFTGVSKFSRVSVFSELNNLNDITMSRKYADMLGYTQHELETYFADNIEQFSREYGQNPQEIMQKFAKQYNGYRFSERNIRVYNPFSVLRALDAKALKNYWFETGTPTFLVNILKERNYPVAKIETLQLEEIVFSVYDIEHLQPEALLFQTGYITIKDVDDNIYSFQYPNQEVKISFLKFLMFAYVPGSETDCSLYNRLCADLRQENLEAFMATVAALYASIPYTLESKRDEAYFHTAFFLMVSASGTNAQSEVLTCDGRIDLVIEFADKIYVIEFKCNQSADAAIHQIREKGYDLKFKPSGKKIILMGIDFDTEKRNVREWKTELS